MAIYKGKTRKIILGIIIFFTLYTALGFLALPAILKSVGIKRISEATMREAQISKIEFNPYNFSLHIYGIKILDHDKETFFSLGEIYVNFEAISAIKLALVFDEVRFVNPYFRLMLDEDGTFNFSDLAQGSREEPEAPKKDDSEDDYLNIIIRNLTLIGGRMTYSDLSRDRTFSTDLHNMKIVVKDFTIEQGEESSFNIHTGTESGESVSLEGAFTLNPLSVTGKLALTGIVLNKYSPYFYEKINFELLDGLFNLKCNYLYKSDEDGDVMKIDGGLIEVRSLILSDRSNGQEFLKIPLFRLAGAMIDVTNSKVRLENILTESGSLLVSISENGETNLQRVFSVNSTPSDPDEQPEEAVEEQEKDTGKKTGSDPWTVELGKFELKNYSVRVDDNTPTEQATLLVDNLYFETGDITFPPKGSPYYFNTSMLINESASLGITADLIMEPLNFNMDIDLAGLILTDFQPYITDSTNLIISDGNFNTSGKLTMSKKDSGAPSVMYNGTLSIDDFASQGRKTKTDLIKWFKLDLPSLQVGYNPTVVNVDTVDIADLYVDLVINSEGKTNLESAFVKRGKPKDNPVETQQPQENSSSNDGGSKVTLKTLKLDNAHVDFMDYSIEPAYETSLSGITGKVTGIVDDSTSLLGIYLKGEFNRYSRISFAGKIHKTNYRNYMDLDIDFQNVNLSPFTPYSSKYLGYKLRKGILNLKLKYRIRRRQLESSNIIYFNRLTLGDKVASEDAPSLPLRLAISLLQDRNGIIDLDVPITGDLNNPKVGIWKIIGKALLNLVTKLAASPFAAIGATLEGDEDMSYVSFEPGTSTLTTDQMKKMDILIDALYNRPGVSLEIMGDADPDSDRMVLRMIVLENMILEEKKKELLNDGQDPETLEEVNIKPRERARYIAQLYGATDFSVPWGDEMIIKPQAMFDFEIGDINLEKISRKIKKFEKNAERVDGEEGESGESEELTVEDMERSLLDYINIFDKDLILLAKERAENVMAYILDGDMVTPDRVFLVEPDLNSEENETTEERNRVIFSLR